MEETKTCTVCNESKHVDMFYKDYSIVNKVGYRSKCKACTNIISKNRAPCEKINIKTKTCNICNKYLEIDEFLKSTRHKDGYMSCCKICHYKKEDNRGCYPKIKRTPEYMKEYWKTKVKDIQYKMKKNIQRSIHTCIRKTMGENNYYRDDKTIGYLSCSIPFFKLWIEYCFDNNMSWDNYAIYWELDHVKPCASFNFNNVQELYECFNWSNYQPLNKKINRSKSDNIYEDIINQHKTRATKFLKDNQDIIVINNNFYSLLLPVGESPTFGNDSKERRELTGSP